MIKDDKNGNHNNCCSAFADQLHKNIQRTSGKTLKKEQLLLYFKTGKMISDKIKVSS